MRETLPMQMRVCGWKTRHAATFWNWRLRWMTAVPAMACGSLITDLVSGRTIEEAIAVTKDKVAEEIGGLPPASGHAAQLAVDAVRSVVKRAIPHE
jgi:hypothetical protein